MISVVIPLYNKELQIAQTLQSVLNQSFQDFEIVVVDDGSNDSSAEAVRSVHDPRIRLIEQSNSGVSAARNRGIAEAKYDLVAFLDADDLWKPTYLQTQYELVQKYPQCDVFACNYEFQDAQGNVTPTIIRKLPFDGEDGILSNYFEIACCSHPPLWTSAVIVRKHAIQQIGGFPVGIKIGEDLLTWAKLAVNFQIAYSTLPQSIYIVDQKLFNNDQQSRFAKKEDIVGNQLAEIYQNNKNKNYLKSYISFWHKMRARVFITQNKRFYALNECFLSLRYKFNWQSIIFIILALFPYKLSNYIFSLRH